MGVEAVSKIEMDERGWRRVDWSIEESSKSEMREGGREVTG